VLAARVLGPVAGVRLTLGSKAVVAAKHAAIMGADVRPGAIDDVIADEKAHVYSTPGLEAEGARLAQVAKAIDKLTHALVQGGGRQPQPDKAPTARPTVPPPITPPRSAIDPVRRQRS